jgi:hypothetical protein
MPSKNTMYAMAASQMGEKVVSNQTVQEVGGDVAKALQSWIKSQIEERKKDK